MIKRGTKKYVPKSLIEAMTEVKLNYHYDKDSMAFHKMAELSRNGMEIERMRDRFMLQDIFGKKRKKR